ncbi:MAG: hypothetical protein JSV09_15870 [Thermoplasmata archaeon]|nr:MAG: hypothetical protein JSV09_15870 [Thermoplasmata archaeon]
MIGTIMGLMVFLAFISLFVLYWVPVMMEDNEASHMRTVIDQFGDLRKMVDNQIITDNRNITPHSPIKLGADGVPMFERETPSELSLKLSSDFYNISFQDNGEDINENAKGGIHLTAYNRFYVRQTLVYSNGAVIISQKKGDVMKIEPTFNVEKEGNNTTLSMTLISLLHDTDDSITGISTEGVTTRLLYTDRWTYTNITSSDRMVEFHVESRYLEVWEDYYDGILRGAGLVDGVDYRVGIMESWIGEPDYLFVEIYDVSEFSLNHAFLEAYIGRAAT